MRLASESSYSQNLVQNTSLEPYNGVWERAQAAHLMRRTHTGVLRTALDALLAETSPVDAVNTILTQSLDRPELTTPNWVNEDPKATPGEHVEDMYSIQFDWMDGMIEGGLLERMKLFWSNHFAVSYFNENNDLPSRAKAYNLFAHVMYEYTERIHTNALGNYIELIKSISKSPAMLYYLNNHFNSASAPNEDFARELLELFTLGPLDSNGQENYSQQDVEEVARSVTGWVVMRNTTRSRFAPMFHDTGSKTIFGQTAAYDLDTVIDLIFEERKTQAATFICRKLYTFFVHAVPNETVVEDLAAYMIEQDFNILETLRKLLSSEHFFEVGFYGARIKSPSEYYMAFFREFMIEPDQPRMNYVRLQMQINSNEELLRPITVFGWDGYNPPKGEEAIPGHFDWLNESYLPIRWQALTDLIMVRNAAVSPFYPQLMLEYVSDPSNPFEVARTLAYLLFAIPLEWVEVSTIEEDFAGDPNIRPTLDGYTEHEINMTKHLLGPMPWYEWAVRKNNGIWTITNVEDQRIRTYLSYLIQLPAYQLF